MIVDLFLVYQFIRRLATPFEKWEAYKLGIIDKDGNILIKRKNFTTQAQEKAFGIFDIMILKLKRLLAKVPGGSSRIASYAAALYLIKEWNHFSDESLLKEDIDEDQLDESLLLFSEAYLNYTLINENVNSSGNKKVDVKPEIDEEVPVNSVASGNIAGMDGSAFSRAAQKRWVSRNKKTKKPTLRNMMGDLQ